jgi:SAM-dependent methyltransferase
MRAKGPPELAVPARGAIAPSVFNPCTPSTDETIPQRLVASRPVTTPSNQPSVRALIERIARRALAAIAPADRDKGAGLAASEQARDAETSEASEVEQAELPQATETITSAVATDTSPVAETATSAQGKPVLGPFADAARDPSDFARELTPRLLAVEEATVSRVLFDRLTEADVLETEQLIRDTPGAWEHYEGAGDDTARRDLLLAFGTWLAAKGLIEKTGLVRAEPPEDVHAMTRGALAAAGGLYEANLIVDALRGVGVETSDLRSALDFGCSSGRVVRSLAAAYPQVEWYGCDPNQPAIAWATENLPTIEFFVNGDAPPLRLADGSLDMAYAISIWSHFAPELGLRWFEEMRRLIRSGGHLVVTTHGMSSVAYNALRSLRAPQQSDEILTSLYRRGCWYAPEFGDVGDWGVVNSEWGTAFLSPEWMLTQLCPLWRVVEYAPGRNQDNQDVYVLQRV